MTVPGPVRTPRVTFAQQDEFARKFFAEAVRHLRDLGDARVLHPQEFSPN